MEEIFRNSLFPRDRKGWGKGEGRRFGWVEDCNFGEGLVGGGKGRKGKRTLQDGVSQGPLLLKLFSFYNTTLQLFHKKMSYRTF